MLVVTCECINIQVFIIWICWYRKFNMKREIGRIESFHPRGQTDLYNWKAEDEHTKGELFTMSLTWGIWMSWKTQLEGQKNSPKTQDGGVEIFCEREILRAQTIREESSDSVRGLRGPAQRGSHLLSYPESVGQEWRSRYIPKTPWETGLSNCLSDS